MCLVSHRWQHMQSKTNGLANEGGKTGLGVHTGKPEGMRVNTTQRQAITLYGQALKQVEIFTYLGSMMTNSGGTDEDIRARIGKASGAFNALKPVWNSQTYSQKNKLRIFKSNVKSVLLYGCETWKPPMPHLSKCSPS